MIGGTMNDFYVYAHLASSTRAKGELFYIGKGRGKRAWRDTDRNDYWHKIVAKYGYSVQILADNLSEQQAFELEKAFILISGREVLCNMTDGGDGVSGHIHSPETRKKLSDSHVGNKHSAETKDKIRIGALRENRSAETLHKMSDATRRRSLSKEARLKISQTLKGHPVAEKARIKFAAHAITKRKKIECSNGMKFDSLTDAIVWVRANGYPGATKSNLSRVCKGERPLAYKLSWKFAK